MTTVFVRPKPGAVVRNPGRMTEILPAEGAEWPMSDFLRRRIADGDVIVTVERAQELRAAAATPEKRPASQARKTKEA